MEENHDIILTPPVDAASVLLLRDSSEGLQVLLMRRAQASQVLGGAYVFPGGKLDAADCSTQALQCLSETPEQLHLRLGEDELPPERAAGLFMAGLREVFEESGVLAGQAQQGQPLATQLRGQVQTLGWLPSVQKSGQTLSTEALLPWSRWVTPRQPSVSSKRFDTRFFLTRIDPGQQARHDNFETTDSVWLTARQALQRYAQGEIDLIAPQIMSLYQLKAHATVNAALDEARQRPPVLVEPHPFNEDGQRVLCYPGDPAHPVQSRAMRGPTRLLLKSGRFVPVEGMQRLLD